MKHHESTIDEKEVQKFAQHAQDWWDEQGPLKTLHDINPCRLEFIKKHADLTQQRLLDVGCGGGILAEALAKAGAQVSAIDAESAAINAAKNHAQAAQLTIDYHCTPIEDFEAKDFDLITCMEMLEHVSNPKLVLEHCQRLLKPGGLLFLSTINRTPKAFASAIIAAEYLLGLLPRQTHEFKKFIKPSELTAIARELGLTLVDIEGMSYNPWTRQAHLIEDVAVNYVMVLSK